MSATEGKRVQPGAAVARWWRAHRWALGQSLARLREHPLGTLLTVAVMGLALALPLSFYLVLVNLAHFGQVLGEGQSINVFLDASATPAMATSLAQGLRADPVVAAVVVKSPQQGLAELASLQGFGPAIAAMPENPLPWVLVVEPRASAGTANVRRLVARLRADARVAQVQDQGPFRDRLAALRAFGGRLMLTLAALLALAAMLVVGASVRNDIQGRAQEIEVLQLVGAGASFVRRPYLYAGLWLGLLSGLVAIGVTLALEAALAGPAARLDAVWGGRLGLATLDPRPLLVMVLAAAMLGWLGARLASARHLAVSEPG